MIALPIAAGALLGRFVDSRLGVGPYGTFVLLGLGIGLAVTEGYRAASRALKVASGK